MTTKFVVSCFDEALTRWENKRCMLDEKTHLIELPAKPVERSRKAIGLNAMRRPELSFVHRMLGLRAVHMMLGAKR